MASHLLDEVEKVCTHVGILKTGKLLQYGNVNEILSEEAMFELSAENFDNLRKYISRLPYVKVLEDKNKRLLIQVE